MKPLLFVSALVLLLLAGAAVTPPAAVFSARDAVTDACSSMMPDRRMNDERAVMTALKTLSTAQADFRANNRVGDGVHQFWRVDVAGLRALAGPDGAPIQLIDAATAEADDRPRLSFRSWIPRSFHGYWFRAIRHADEKPGSLDPDRFAFCAFPASPRAGNWIFVVDENNSIFRRPAPFPGGVNVFPTDDELKTFWSRGG